MSAPATLVPPAARVIHAPPPARRTHPFLRVPNVAAVLALVLTLLQLRVDFTPREQTILDHMRHPAENGAALVKRMMDFARKHQHPLQCVME